jgi:hypothetical protein
MGLFELPPVGASAPSSAMGPASATSGRQVMDSPRWLPPTPWADGEALEQRRVLVSLGYGDVSSYLVELRWAVGRLSS